MYWALLYPFFYNLRLVMLVYVTIYMDDYLILQLVLTSLSTIFIMFVLSHHPFNDLRENYLSAGLAGEAIILVF